MMLALARLAETLLRRLGRSLLGPRARSRAAASGLLLGALGAACAPPPTAGPPAPSPVGYERLQQAYAVWQLLDRARDATAQLKSWRELDPETGSSWDYAVPN